MTKPLISFEPFQNLRGEYLVPATVNDEINLVNLGMMGILVSVFEDDLRSLCPRKRFDAVPLTVKNLVELEKVCKIEITWQTIDK